MILSEEEFVTFSSTGDYHLECWKTYALNSVIYLEDQEIFRNTSFDTGFNTGYEYGYNRAKESQMFDM